LWRSHGATAIAGNILGEATPPAGNSFNEATRGLRKRKKAFLDESARLFLADYEKYRDDLLK
jgi:hypothetical protein